MVGDYKLLCSVQLQWAPFFVLLENREDRISEFLLQVLHACPDCSSVGQHLT